MGSPTTNKQPRPDAAQMIKDQNRGKSFSGGSAPNFAGLSLQSQPSSKSLGGIGPEDVNYTDMAQFSQKVELYRGR